MHVSCEANDSGAPKWGMGHSAYLEAESSLNEEGDQCSNEIAPLARPDIVFAPIGSCSNRQNSIASDQKAVLKVPHCTSEACMQVSTPGSITNMTQKGGSWHSEAKPGSASTPVSSPESQQPCSPLQEAASAVDEQQTSHSSSQVGRPSQHLSQQCLCALSSAAVN